MQSVHVLNAMLGQWQRASLHDPMPQSDPLKQGDETRAQNCVAQRAFVLSAQVDLFDVEHSQRITVK